MEYWTHLARTLRTDSGWTIWKKVTNLGPKLSGEFQMSQAFTKSPSEHNAWWAHGCFPAWHHSCSGLTARPSERQERCLLPDVNVWLFGFGLSNMMLDATWTAANRCLILTQCLSRWGSLHLECTHYLFHRALFFLIQTWHFHYP